MGVATITVPVDAKVAAAYTAAPAEEQQRLQRWLNLWLREVIVEPSMTLQEIMDQMSQKAEARGLTPEELEAMLHEL